MSNEQQVFIPEVTINNTSEKKTVEIDGKKQEVEVQAKEGFNIKTKDLGGNYNKEFFMKEFKGTILFDRYQIQSKYNVKPMFMSNEFEFTGKRNNVRVYCPEKRQTIYEGDYQGAKEHFSTGEMNSANKPVTTYDVFAILYVLIDKDVYRFRWKMNQNNNWFDYKDRCAGEDSERDNKDYRNYLSNFKLETKKFGSNEFWACTLVNEGAGDKVGADEIGDELEASMDSTQFTKKETPKPVEEPKESEIEIENIPF